MRITVRYLGGSRDQTRCRQETMEVQAGTTIDQLAERVAAAHPALAPLLPSVRWARNLEFVAMDETVRDGDVVAVLPPVSGGAPQAELTEATIDPAGVLQRVASPSHGATVLFIGTVRDHARGKQVDRLEYEAYAPMALRQLERIAQSCTEQYPGTEVAITHRHGRLEIGDISVAIAAASAHRDEAFSACREAIEKIKADVPIWKQEFTTDSDTWVGWGGG